MAAITASELLAGVAWPARPEAQRKASEVFVEGVLASMPIVAFDLGIARAHARLYAELKSNRVKILEHDLQIAVTALVLGHPVATRDERSFPKVPGLKVEVVRPGPPRCRTCAPHASGTRPDGCRRGDSTTRSPVHRRQRLGGDQQTAALLGRPAL